MDFGNIGARGNARGNKERGCSARRCGAARQVPVLKKMGVKQGTVGRERMQSSQGGKKRIKEIAWKREGDSSHIFIHNHKKGVVGKQT